MFFPFLLREISTFLNIAVRKLIESVRNNPYNKIKFLVKRSSLVKKINSTVNPTCKKVVLRILKNWNENDLEKKSK
jgi:hypothetical protein